MIPSCSEKKEEEEHMEEEEDEQEEEELNWTELNFYWLLVRHTLT